MRRKDLDSLVRRSRDLFAVVGEHAPAEPEEVCAALVCNSCGRTEMVRAASRVALEEAMPVLVEGWTITPRPVDKDLCPGCSEAQAA